MSNELQTVPFGKYKGQPVEMLQSDPQYCQWLASQDWFVGRYPQINTLIINNFCEQADTPEHNALQARFLDSDFIERFVKKAFNYGEPQDIKDRIKAQIEYCAKRSKEDLNLYCAMLRKQVGSYHFECNKCECYKALNDETTGKISVSDAEFEVLGNDVVFGFYIYNWGDYHNVLVEVKPCLGDDYPSVLRQIKANAKAYVDKKREQVCVVLLYDKFTATSVCEKNVRMFFKASNVCAFRFNEIDKED